ncbi:MAG: peptidoglycan-binding protein [Okeania sp. SIO3I5]|uniref:peptidoglycan-binding domain-containing protein n=1 Tax=Okeania sp. SIO3I5 TaxID=2607805 RepID=UPI0013BCA963|nr:peptidoglycan-binding protein [Okeania sp. SIO3I5]NEQ36171.1 peptidoglycan-binding protein [Okeania sp. SIO3I5]
MMRIPTITTLLSLVALFNFTPARAIASNKTEPLITEKEGSLIPKLNSNNFIFEQLDRIKTKLPQKQENQNFLIPFIPENSRFSSKPAEPELFSEPFYPGVPQKQKNQKNISEGSRGAEVWAVQRRLQARGFNPGAIDSLFGARTTKAVRAFQKSVGFTVTGIVDEATWTALAKPSFASRSTVQREKLSQTEKLSIPKQNQVVEVEKILAKGDRGSKVKTLQMRLETMGFNPGPIDGIFGKKTIGAVKEFQKSKGIKADGIVNQKTWAAFSQKSK